MLDVLFTLLTIGLMLYAVLAIGLETYDPIEQFHILSKRLGVLKGIAIVVIVFLATSPKYIAW